MTLFETLHETFRSVLLIATAYLVLVQLIRLAPEKTARASFGILNVVVTFFIVKTGFKVKNDAVKMMIAYFAFTSTHYFLTLFLARKGRRFDWIPLVFPIVALLTVKANSIAWFTGISYMVFRLSHLALEYRNETFSELRYFDYQGFAFFLPTFIMGPINPYSTHLDSLSALTANKISGDTIWTSFYRCALGLLKLFFFANLFNQIAFEGLLLDARAGHHALDFIYASVFYYLYLYCDFSGFIDIMLGFAALTGIKVHENFDRPFIARNVKDFWNRWHITLSTYMRDMVFSPLSSTLARRVDPKYINHVIPLAIAPVFLLIGFWHGTGWNYILFGAIHAFGVIVNHYYTIFLKKNLTRENFKKYNNNVWIKRVSIAITFLYVAMSFFFFANDFSQMEKIRNAF